MIVRILVSVLLLFAVTIKTASAQYTVNTSFNSPTNMSGLWWNASESGWGITVTQQGNIAFVTMFTYDSQGAAVWYVASNCAISTDNCHGVLYRVSGGRAPTAPWAGAVVSPTAVGNFTLRMTDVNNATITYIVEGISSSKTVTRQVFNAPPPVVSQNQANTELLVGGTWTLAYNIGTSPFSNQYVFTRTEASTTVVGQWYAFGPDSTVIGAYTPSLGRWAILDQGSIIDRYFVFTISGNNSASGCYYQLNPPGSTNLGTCYNMLGFRSPAKSSVEPSSLERLRQETLERDLAAQDHAFSQSPSVEDLQVLQELQKAHREFSAR